MGFYKLSIYSNAFSHLMKVLKTNQIAEIYARREWITEGGQKKIHPNIPFLFKREKREKRIGIVKQTKLEEPFPKKEVIKWLVEEDVGDLAVLSFSIILRSDILKELLERKIGKEIIDNRFILRFKANHEKNLEKLRREVAKIMKKQIDNFGFKIATLDLEEIYYLEDYKKERNFPLIEEVQKNKNLLKNLADEFLKEFIKIDGTQRRIRGIKFYDYDQRNILVLKEMETI